MDITRIVLAMIKKRVDDKMAPARKIVVDLEKKIEKIGREIEYMIDTERLARLVKEEMSDIDVIMGVLLQTRGLLRMERRFADDVEEYINDMLTISTALVHCINHKCAKKRKKGKKDE